MISIPLEIIQQIIKINTDRTLSSEELKEADKFISNNSDLRATIIKWIVINSFEIEKGINKEYPHT